MKNATKRKPPEFVVIEIPRTGCSSVVRLLGDRALRHAKPHAPTDEVRKAVGQAKWKRLKKITVVRSVVDRFTSACITLGLSCDEAVSIMRRLPEEEWPVALLPQSRWLRCAFDVVLTTRTIAQFANEMQFGVSVYPANVSPAPSPDQRPAARHLEEIAELYAEDIERFKTLRVWHPDPDVVMLVGGRCRECESSLAAIKGMQEVAPAPSIEPSVPPADEIEPEGEAAGQ